MNRILSFILLIVSLFYACRAPIDGTMFMECPGNDTYALDLFSPPFFSENWLWLSDETGEIAYEEELLIAGGGSAATFFNYDNSCASTYTVSIGLGPNGFSSFSEETTLLQVEQVAEVPSGTALSLFGDFSSATFPDAILIRTIEVKHCPPVDSLQVSFGKSQFLSSDSYEAEYNAADSILLIYITQQMTSLQDGWLTIRTADDQQWHGQLFPFTPGFLDIVDFQNLQSLESKTIDITADATIATIKVEMVTNETFGRTALLGFYTGSDVNVIVPQDVANVLIEVKVISPNYSYESRRHYDLLPGEVAVTSENLKLEDFNLNYPTLEFTATGSGDVIQLMSETNTNLFGSIRSFISPVKEGFQSIRLPDIGLSYAIEGTSLKMKYDTAFDSGTIELIDYIAIDNSYVTFLRKVIGSPTSQDGSIQQEYDKIIINY